VLIAQAVSLVELSLGLEIGGAAKNFATESTDHSTT
jgi:hypothetical protein